MGDDFFGEYEVVSKCHKCPLKKNSHCYNDKIMMINKGYDVLFVLESNEPSNRLQYFINKVDRIFTSYSIINGINCSPKNGEMPSPIYKIYRHCNNITEELASKYKVVVTIGSGLQAITQSSDINTYEDFTEFLFNQTYFYTRYDWKKKTRVYPIPRITDWQGQDNFRSFFVNKQFTFVKEYLKNYSEFQFEDYNCIKIENCDEFLEQNNDKEYVAWDTETNNLNCFVDDFKIGCLTLSFDGKNGYYLPFDKIDKNKLNLFFKNKKGIGANLKYDIKAMSRYDIDNCVVDEDVILLYHLLNTVRETNSLKSLAWLIGFGGYDTDLDDFIQKYKIKNYLEIPEDLLYKYACIDAIVAYRLFDYAKENLIKKQSQVYKLYKETVIPVIPAFIEMEINGLLVNMKYLNEYHNKIQEQIKELEIEIKKEIGKDVEISSNEQLGKALEKLGLPDLGRTKKGHFQTGADILQQWINLGFDIVKKIEKYRALCKLDDTFVGDIEKRNGITQYIMSDKRVHGTFSPAMTSSMRASSNSPNLQNFPHYNEEGKTFRKIFTCPENYYIAEADFAGFQLRIACIESDDENMKNVFLNLGGDMHSFSAKNIFCKDITLEEFLEKKGEEPYKTLRYKAKNQINFPLLFSSSSYVIYGTIRDEWSEKERLDYIEENNLTISLNRDEQPDTVLTVINDIHKKFFETYSGLRDWIKMNLETTLSLGYNDSLFGGRRHLPQLLYKGETFDRSEWTNLCNIATNSRIQNFEAITAYKVLTKIHSEMKRRRLKSKLVGAVHDSIVFYIHKDEVEIMYNLTLKYMNNTKDYIIPILGDFSLGEIWGFSKEITAEDLPKFRMATN
ncbi:MAG TPA: DNA polymerase [Candidatus Pacearchaeota archaeon]|nr:DNA polymerase [Candidatus Pacearchaeota archaeon]